MTCARLRALCTPMMFKVFVVDDGIMKREDLPFSLLLNFRIIHIYSSSSSEHPKLEAVLHATTNIP